MARESEARALNIPTGELRSRPLAVLLAAAAERGTSGTFTFTAGSRRDTLIMRGGKIAAVRTAEPIAYLGGVLYELGAIDIATLNETLQEVASAKRLHGDILVERGCVTRERVEEGLIEQTLRKAHHLFTLPIETRWTFQDGVDELAGARDEARPAVDTWRAIWRGLRDHPATAHVRQILAKIDGGIQLRDLAAVHRFVLAPEEMAVCERLNAQPSTFATLAATSGLSLERTELLVYLLTLGRCIVRVELHPIGPVELGIEGVRERARRIDHESPHTILCLPSGASLEAARAAFFRLARLWHPDKIPLALAEVRAECQHVFVRLGEAHRILTNISARISVDAMIGADNVGAANDPMMPQPPSAKTLGDADAALARNDIAGADAIARTLTSTGRDGPGARAVLAWCAIGASASANAERPVLESGLHALDKLLTGDPDCVRALFYRAQVLRQLGRTDEALRDYRKIIRLEPRHVDAQREVRLSEIRQRAASQSGLTASSAGRSSAPSPAPLAPPAHDSATGKGAPVKSGIRRWLARVAGSK